MTTLTQIIRGKNRAFVYVQDLAKQRQRELTASGRVLDRTRLQLAEGQKVYKLWCLELQRWQHRRRVEFERNLGVMTAAMMTATRPTKRPKRKRKRGRKRK